MVPFILKKTIVLSLTLTSLTAFAQAATYTTMADGDWSDPTIWSTDGGATSCGCIPTEPTAGNNIVLKHDVDLVGNSITINGGSQVTVVAYQGEIHWSGPGGGTIDVQNGQLYVNNYISVNQLNIGVDGNVTIVGYSEMFVQAGFDVFGHLHVYGGYLCVSTGNLKFETTADVQLTNFSKIEVINGNLNNEGSVYIGGNCCIETRGAWENESTGTVSGHGSAHSTNGAFKNFNTWQATVNWCGGGNPQNMPPEDCLEAQNECGMLVLGATFGELEAFVQHEKEVKLVWTTITEQDNDYFLVQRSQNGYDFESIGLVDGNGTTEWEMSYAFIDPAPFNGLSYYRLEQVNFNGEADNTQLKAVELTTEEPVIVSSYNLMGQEINQNYTGVVIDLLDDGSTRKRFRN